MAYYKLGVMTSVTCSNIVLKVVCYEMRVRLFDERWNQAEALPRLYI